jgi:hypothetical protein
MAKRVFTSGGLTFTASAAGSQATQNGYMSLVGAAATQITDVLEVLITGKAAASVVTAFYLARQSTLGTGGAVALAAQQSDAPMHFATGALAAPVVAAVDYTTNEAIPSAATTDAKLNLGINSFGGILRWNAAPTQQWSMVGNTASGGGTILWNSSLAGGATALADAHIIYETV